MSEHYFTSQPTSESRPVPAVWKQGDTQLTFITDAGVFSRGEIDRGSMVLLRALAPLTGRVLDLGCGYGFLGLAIKYLNPACQVALCDINQRAVELSRRNAAALGLNADIFPSDGLAVVTGSFDHIITNPPVKAGKALYYGWFADARQYLAPGGDLTLVLQRKHGAPSALSYLRTLYPKVEVLDKSGGFHVLRATLAG